MMARHKPDSTARDSLHADKRPWGGTDHTTPTPRDQHGLNKPASPVGPAHHYIHTMKRLLTSDWGPTLYLWTAQLAGIIVAVYVAGRMFGEWLHRLNDRIARITR